MKTMRAIVVGCVGLAGSPAPAQHAADAKKVDVEEKWLGAFSPQMEQKVLLVKTGDDWEKLWAKAISRGKFAKAVPKVDFSKHMVVAVFTGSKPSGGYSVDIDWAEMTAAGVIVHVSKTVPDPDKGYAAVTTSPFALVVLPKTDGKVFAAIDGVERIVTEMKP